MDVIFLGFYAVMQMACARELLVGYFFWTSGGICTVPLLIVHLIRDEMPTYLNESVSASWFKPSQMGQDMRQLAKLWR